MIYGKLLSTGELVDMSHREPVAYADGSSDVPLSEMPLEVDRRYTYNPTTKKAVVSDTLTQASRRVAKKVILDGNDMLAQVVVAICRVNWNRIPQLRTAFPTFQGYVNAIKAQIDSE